MMTASLSGAVNVAELAGVTVYSPPACVVGAPAVVSAVASSSAR
jgi:hypothetical protein